jgi:hypothetical protein
MLIPSTAKVSARGMNTLTYHHQYKRSAVLIRDNATGVKKFSQLLHQILITVLNTLQNFEFQHVHGIVMKEQGMHR